MLYLSGVHTPDVYTDDAMGLLFNPFSGNLPVCSMGYKPFAIDNGCFIKGDRFRMSDYLRYLDRFAPFASGCLFAVCPDVYPNAQATHELYCRYAPELRARGFPVAYVLQNGQESFPVPSDSEAVFVGGDTGWKVSIFAASVVADVRAARPGVHVHMGRVNSRQRYDLARRFGCDSVDGTFLAYAPRANYARLVGWRSVDGRTLRYRQSVICSHL